MAKFVGADENNRVRGYCFLEFAPSEEAVIRTLNEKGRCVVYYHLSDGTIMTEDWENTESEITGPRLYNGLRNRRFVKAHHNRIEKIVLSQIN